MEVEHHDPFIATRDRILPTMRLATLSKPRCTPRDHLCQTPQSIQGGETSSIWQSAGTVSMSVYGYERKFSGVPADFRCWPESRPSWANVRFPADFVRFTSRSRLSWWCRLRSVPDPQETIEPQACNVSLGEPGADVGPRSAGGQFIARRGHRRQTKLVGKTPRKTIIMVYDTVPPMQKTPHVLDARPRAGARLRGMD